VTATPPPDSLRDRLLAALDEDAHRPRDQRQGLVNAMLAVAEAELAARDAENARLRAELAEARNATLTEAAEMLRQTFVYPNEAAGMDAAADLLDAARTPTS
jgi:hypothetical protein